MRALALHSGKNSSDLLAPLARAKSQMHGDNAHQCRQSDLDAYIECAARLVIADREIEMIDTSHRKTGQDRIAEVRAATLAKHTRDDVIARRLLEIAKKILVCLL